MVQAVVSKSLSRAKDTAHINQFRRIMTYKEIALFQRKSHAEKVLRHKKDEFMKMVVLQIAKFGIAQFTPLCLGLVAHGLRDCSMLQLMEWAEEEGFTCTKTNGGGFRVFAF